MDEQNLLRGYNFGIRTGSGTSETLLVTQACIYDVSAFKKPLIMATLDIQKLMSRNDTIP